MVSGGEKMQPVEQALIWALIRSLRTQAGRKLIPQGVPFLTVG